MRLLVSCCYKKFLPHNRKNGRVGYISQLNGNRGIGEYLLRMICGLIGAKIFYNCQLQAVPHCLVAQVITY